MTPIRSLIISLAAIFFFGINTVHAQWSFNGVKIFYNAGNVGVGTNNPAYKLDVRTATNDRAVFGYNSAAAGTMYGVYGRSDSIAGRALFGYASATTGTNYALFAQSNSTAGFGVYGLANAGTGTNYGVYGRSNSTSGRAMYALANASTGVNYGIVAKTNSPDGYAGYFVGNVWVTGWIGTKANAPVDLYSRNHRVFRVHSVQDSTVRAVNVIAGVETNSVADGVIGATIAGGGSSGSVDGGPGPNTVTVNYGTIGGGVSNAVNNATGTIAGGAFNTIGGDLACIGGGNLNNASGNWATIAGGSANLASSTFTSIGGGNDNSATGGVATIAGGQANTASGNRATIAGGQDNVASNTYATIAGGLSNEAAMQWSSIGGGNDNSTAGGSQGASYASVVGGAFNTASAQCSTVAGGCSNTAIGDYSFAAGRRANANHHGSFVLGDSTDDDISSSANNQFTARASGGARFFSNSIATVGVQLAAGGNSWSAMSDRAVKSNIKPIDGRDILCRLSQLPISKWNLISQDESIQHIGPMAQDFHAAFGIGEDERHISQTDADGVALAAIQGLHQIINEKDASLAMQQGQIASLESANADQARMLQDLARRVVALEGKLTP